MDFKALSKNLKPSFEVEIIHPATGEGGWFIELAAPHHADAQAKVLTVLARIRKQRVSTPAQEEKDGIDLLAARVLGWRGLTDAGEDVPYTSETLVKILSTRESFWIRNQIVEALGDPSLPFSA